MGEVTRLQENADTGTFNKYFINTCRIVRNLITYNSERVGIFIENKILDNKMRFLNQQSQNSKEIP